MKVFALIFSTYIFSLSVIICPDGITQRTFYDVTEMSASHQDHDHSKNSTDDCTPFCACSCCGTLMVMPIVCQNTNQSIDLSSSYLIHYTFHYSHDYSGGIWHPPSKTSFYL